jgi:DNA-binding beta-propeller fold protein YncE
MKNLLKVFVYLATTILWISGEGLKAQNTAADYKIANRIQLPGDGGWDYLAVDETGGRVFLSHGMVVQVVDLKTKTLAGTIEDTKGVHGIALAYDLNKGYISNGRDTSVTVIDLKTLKFISRIKITGMNPDAILYDPFSRHIFTFNGRTSNSTVIDATTDKVVGTIALDGKPEFSQTDGKGKVYVNIEDKSEISVIDSKALKVVKTWSIAPGEEPSGLALDNENHRLFSVCGNKLMVISDAVTGKVVASVPIGDRCDGVAFDPIKKLAYSSNGEGTITIVRQKDKDNYEMAGTFPTQPGAKTIAIDRKSHKLYLTTGSFEAPAAQGQRPAMKPNSFVLLEIESLK